MSSVAEFDAPFAGVIGQDYQMLKLICPLSAEMSRLVGVTIRETTGGSSAALSLLEIGGGTGITTLAILSADERLRVLSVDNEPNMQRQAQRHLSAWVDAGRLSFCGDDALTALQALQDESLDLVASAYTLHNFEHTYRQRVIGEIYRVLKPGGRFINGDRYALDDVNAHTATVKQEMSGYFRVLTDMNRLDLLEQWIVHLFNDESENHIMRESGALEQLCMAGFGNIRLTHRMEVNALVTADKFLSD